MRSTILAFVFGVWCLQQMPELPSWGWAMILGLPVVLGWAIRTRGGEGLGFVQRIVLLSGAVLAGFFFAAVVAQGRLADALPAAWEGQDIQLVGVVAALPQVQERGERFLFEVEQVETPGAQVPGRISVSRYFTGYREPAPAAAKGEFHAGERWRLTVRLKRPHGTYNPHGFDFEAWALERGIRATGYVRKHPDNARLDAMVMRPAYLVERARENIRDRFRQVLGEARYGGVLLALAVGDDGAIAPDDWQVFLRTGVNHLMSISGLHVTMVAGLAFALVHAGWRRSGLALRVPARKAAALAGLAAAGSYALLAGYAVPTQRTLYMLAVISAALWLGRAASISLVLCWALLLVVLLDPWAVLAPGFWLSFGAVGLLAYAGAARLARPSWLHQAAHAQWVVTLGLTPLLLALFQQASLVSPLANAFAIPLVSLVVTPLTLLGAVIPIDAILLVAHGVMAWCMWMLERCADFPASVWQQHAPPAWTVVVAVLGVLWLLLPRGFPLRWAGAAALAPMFLLLPSPPSQGELHAAVLDVGQGLAVVLQTEHHALLYDTGARYSEDSDSGLRVILPYLRGTGIRQLDGLVLSHDDSDHTGGVASVLQGVATGWVASPLPQGHPLLDGVAHALPCFNGQAWTWDGVRFEMMHPDSASYSVARLKDNARSCVLKASTRHGSLLLPADIERASERDLIERHAGALATDVLVAPHHGSGTSSTEAFIRQVAPQLTVFTVGYRNRFGHPKADVVRRYADAGGRLFRSDHHGAVLLDFSARGIAIRPWRAIRPRYWQDRVAENSAAG